MRKIIFWIIVICITFGLVIAGNFTYKVRDSDTLFIGSLSSPRATLSTTGVDIQGNLTIAGNITTSNTFSMLSNLSIVGTLNVASTSIFSNTLSAIGDLSIGADLSITSNTIASGTVNILGVTIISNTLNIISNATVDGTLIVIGQTTISNNIVPFEKVTSTNITNALNPDILVSLVTTVGAHVIVLSNGSFTGQTKKIMLSVDGGDLTLLPVNFADATGLTFDAIMDSVELIFDGTDWNMMSASSVTTN